MVLRPAGYFEAFRPWRRVLSPVSLYFKKATVTSSIPLTAAVVAGPGYSLAHPSTATTPQSDQHVVFTVTFSTALTTHGNTPITTGWSVTNGTLLSATYQGTYSPYAAATYLVVIHATATGAVTLQIPSASNTSIYGVTNSSSNTGSVTFTPDTVTTTRKTFFGNDLTGVASSIGAIAQASDTHAVMYWEPRVDLDLTTIASLSSSDLATATHCLFSAASKTGPGFTWPSGPVNLALFVTFSGTAPYTATVGIRSGASGSPLRTVFGGQYDGTAIASIGITP